MACQLCETRKERRFCPAARASICAPCCGAEREQSMGCPLDCEYLRESRLHEKLIPLEGGAIPHRDIRLADDFVQDHADLVVFTGRTLFESAMGTEGAVDRDAREALEAMVKTFRTLDSGLIYETRPTNPYAAAIQANLQSAIENFRQEMARELGLTTLRDSEVMGVLVFFLRLAVQFDNGRRRGRRFLDFLRERFPAAIPKGA